MNERLARLEKNQASLAAETRGQSKMIGRILMEVQNGRKDNKEHASDDLKFQQAQADKNAALTAKQAEMKAEIGWIKKAGALLWAATIGHWFIK